MNKTTNNFGLSEETTNTLLEVFQKFPQVKEVKVFGSRAIGNYRPGSDIDLALYADSLVHHDYMEILRELEDLELLYEIDCIDYHNIKEPALQEHIDIVGKTLYKGDL